MPEKRIVAIIRDHVSGSRSQLRISRVDAVTATRFLAALVKRNPELEGLDLVLSCEGVELEGSETLDSLVNWSEEVDDSPRVELDIRRRESAPPVHRLATTLLGLVDSAPARYQGKNRVLLERVLREETPFARAGSLLVNWCDDDFESFSEGERAQLVSALVEFVHVARRAPEDASYNAVLASSHVASRLPWDDDEFCAAFSEVVEALLLHVRGGEGTAYTQRALERLSEGVELPPLVRGTVDRVFESLWKPAADVEVGSSNVGNRPVTSAGAERLELDLQRAELDDGSDLSSASSSDLYAEARKFVRGNPHVALLIDLENLVYGIRAQYGDEAVARMVDFESIYVYAAQFGNVSVVNAYADWKYRIMNQFQRDLYNHGVELVHVLGKGRKNAADLRMAVDVTELVFAHSEIETFVIVSGDRDFIEILKQIRRHGKRVVGVANQYSVNRDFARLFDDFRSYLDVWRDYHRPGTDHIERTGRETRRPEATTRRGGRDSGREVAAPGGVDGGTDQMDCDSTAGGEFASVAGGSGAERGAEGAKVSTTHLKETLHEILEEHGARGLKGARIKPLLRERIDPCFHERDYGFSSIAALLRSLPDVALIVELEGGGDILVFSATGARSNDDIEQLLEGRRLAAHDPVRELVRRARLNTYRFEPNLEARRRILDKLYTALSTWGSFVWEEVYAALRDDPDEPLSPTLVSKYQAVLYQNYLFTFIDDDDAVRILKQRRAQLDSSITSLDDFVRGYELGIVKKLIDRLEDDVEIDDVRCLLGCSASEEEVAYCEELLAEARQALGASVDGASPSDAAEAAVDADEASDGPTESSEVG